jgi:hypothetical protein
LPAPGERADAAGTISRISGIEFRDYKERFFEPLKNIVTAEDDPYSDYVYRTRHPRVATLVYRQVCPNDETRARQFIRLIDGLDIESAALSRRTPKTDTEPSSCGDARAYFAPKPDLDWARVEGRRGVETGHSPTIRAAATRYR